jgi:predicted SprT family Zn-dependent metalloprotease
MRICLRTRDAHEKIYDIDLLMYVVLHELAHVCNYTRYGIPIQGHGNEFKNIFKFLVEEAVSAGLYVYTDYSKSPVNYCNMILSSSIL